MLDIVTYRSPEISAYAAPPLDAATRALLDEVLANWEEWKHRVSQHEPEQCTFAYIARGMQATNGTYRRFHTWQRGTGMAPELIRRGLIACSHDEVGRGQACIPHGVLKLIIANAPLPPDLRLYPAPVRRAEL